MILLWKGIPPFKRVGEKYPLHFTVLQRPEITYDAVI